jgi:hypothetical protein
MRLDSKRTALLIGGGAIAALAVAGTTSAFADDATTTDDTTTTTTAPAPEIGHGMHGDMTTITDFLGLTEAELHAEFEAGKTLAEITEAQGKSVDALIDLLVAEAETEITERVNNPMPDPGLAGEAHGRGGHGGPGGPGHDGMGDGDGDCELADDATADSSVS